MNSIEIAPNIFWVGYVDWDVRDFHGYRTGRGTTYNAYLVVGEKIALIDTVKAPYGHVLLSHVAERIDPARIDYVISNHTEPDHSGTLEDVRAAAPNARFLCSEKGKVGLEHYYHAAFDWQVVKAGDHIDLGGLTLEFLPTPMLHWPDSMFTYVPERKLLFSMDAFGQHLATNRRFDTEVEHDVLIQETKTYYANIIMHLGSVVQRTLKAAAEMDIETICPSHGIIWTEHRHEAMALYRDWATFKPQPKVLVVYDTMWRSTEIMAETLVEALTREGLTVKKFRLGINDLTMLVTEVLDAAALLVGAPTLNNNLMPNVAAFLTYLKGLRPRHKVGMAFGSYGWSGGAVPQTAALLKEAGLDVLEEEIACVYRPDADTLKRLREAAQHVAQLVKNKLGE